MPKRTPEQHSAEDSLLTLPELLAAYSASFPRFLARLAHGASVANCCEGRGCPSYLGVSRLLMEQGGDSIPEIVAFRSNFFVAQEAASRLHMDQLIELADKADDKNAQSKVALQMKALLEHAERISPHSFAKARRQFDSVDTPEALANKLENAFLIIAQRNAARQAEGLPSKRPAIATKHKP